MLLRDSVVVSSQHLFLELTPNMFEEEQVCEVVYKERSNTRKRTTQLFRQVRHGRGSSRVRIFVDDTNSTLGQKVNDMSC